MTKLWMGKKSSVPVKGFGIHESPPEWREACTKIDAIIREQFMLPSDITLNVWVCRRGGWRHGYHATGSIGIKFSWKDGRHEFSAMKSVVYRGEYDVQKILKWWLRHNKEYHYSIVKLNALKLYLESKLIPRRIAKAYQAKLRLKYGRYGDPTWDEHGMWTDALEMGQAYVTKHSVCPYCKAKGKFQYNILGFECTECRMTWEDYNVHKCHWEKN